MKRIGDIAARLVANPIELVAAANQKRSTEFADGSPNEGVTSEPSRRNVREDSTRATGMGKGPEREAPASQRGSVEQPGGTEAAGSYGERMNPTLPTGRHRRTAFAAAQGQAHVPAVRLCLVVDNTRGHAALRSNTGMSMRSRNS